eukprot:5971770-Amphidinium_carterae.1
MAHQLASECIGGVWGEPLHAFFEKSERVVCNTPLSALVHFLQMMGFESGPNGLYASRADALVPWPQDSIAHFMHDLRDAMRKIVLLESRAGRAFHH